MRANPGGILAPEDVVGRDHLIEHLWRVLDAQSVVLTSERRVGKTSVIRKMVGASEPGRLCFLRDVEGFRSPSEFIEGIYADVEPILSKRGKSPPSGLGTAGEARWNRNWPPQTSAGKTPLEESPRRTFPGHIYG